MAENHDSNISIGAGAYRIVGRKSWVAYLVTLIKYTLLFFAVYLVNKQAGMYTSISAVYVFYAYAFFAVLFVYRLAVLRSYRIGVTDEGIWLNHGILPWAKFGNGIRWNDADMAFYRPTFISWITNSYRISVAHKYTNASDFVVSDIWDGRTVADEISKIQRQRLES